MQKTVANETEIQMTTPILAPAYYGACVSIKVCGAIKLPTQYAIKLIAFTVAF